MRILSGRRGGLSSIAHSSVRTSRGTGSLEPDSAGLEAVKLNYCPCGADCALENCDLHYTGSPQIYLKDYAPTPTQNVPYNKTLADAYIASAGRQCAGEIGLDWRRIASCAFATPSDPTSWPGTRGLALEQDAASKTAHLSPEHQGVPWVLVDGTPLSNTTKLLETVCDAAKAKGLAVPAGCA